MREYSRFRPDVTHVHGYYGFSYGLFFKLAFRCPLVDSVPAMFSQMVEQGTGWLMNQYRRYHRLVDCFFLAPGYRSELRGIGVPAEKLFDLTGTVDLQAVARFKTETARHRAEVRARLGIAQDSLIVLSVGRLDSSKGHRYALEALPSMLDQFPNLHWVLLGEGAERLELEARIRELGISAHAHLIGFEPEPLPFYAAADIYLRTPIMEAENISSCYAIATELPAVGFDTCRAADLILKLGHGLLVPNKDAPALASAVARILSMPDRGRLMGGRGIDYCRAQLDLQKQVDGLSSVYTALAQSKGRKRNNWREGLTLDV
jgi:glycosyltransferase involved in cell wall biosynthesis